MGAEFLQLDLPALLAAALAGMTCGLLGSFLLLRRESLLGDAISHAVLPGIVLGFAATGVRSGWPMLVGATLAAMTATVLIGWLRRVARLEGGAATGIVFTGFFALGLVLLEATGAREVDLDVDCVLFGQIESLVWLEAVGWHSLLDPVALGGCRGNSACSRRSPGRRCCSSLPPGGRCCCCASTQPGRPFRAGACAAWRRR